MSRVEEVLLQIASGLDKIGWNGMGWDQERDTLRIPWLPLVTTTYYVHLRPLVVGENCMLSAAREMSSEGESICIMAEAGTQEGRQCSRAVDG